MTKKNGCVALLIDKDNERWLFEGKVQGLPIWTPEDEARPKIMSEIDAYIVASMFRQKGDIAMVKKANYLSTKSFI